jgi:hypothetical protein
LFKSTTPSLFSIAMRIALLLTIASFCSLALLPTNARAQAAVAFASSAAYEPTGSGGGTPAAATPRTTEPGEMMVLVGKITNPAGVLPGAVVILTGTKQMAVTNADGEFQFVVPATAGALPALVTYAGYADEKMTLNAALDESTVSLTNAQVIVVSRRQQLKRYLKTARKQVKHDLRQVRSQN